MSFSKGKAILDLNLLRQDLFYLKQSIPDSVKSQILMELIKSIEERLKSLADNVRGYEVEESEEENE
jgi:hypothetical protein